MKKVFFLSLTMILLVFIVGCVKLPQIEKQKNPPNITKEVKKVSQNELPTKELQNVKNCTADKDCPNGFTCTADLFGSGQGLCMR